MALPSFFKRKAPTPKAPVQPDPLADEAGPVQAARARARRRLIGAVVLLAAGVTVFPMLFETQPRPLPRDIPIELPRREGATSPKPAVVPRNAAAVTELPVAEPASPVLPGSAPAVGADASPTPTPVSEPAPAVPVAEPKASAAKPEAPKPDLHKAETVKPDPPKPAAPPQPPEPKKAESDRARAALEGRSDAPAAASTAAADSKAGRFVVQVGAYTDANTLREVRAKVEKLGLKTYTQSVDTEAGKRTRVRVGPFTTRPEAESASAKLKAAGLPGNVLVL